MQGGYFDSEFRPFQLPNAGTHQMQSALEKYEHFSSSQFPNFSQYESWLGADLMIKGLRAGRQEPDPGRRSSTPSATSRATTATDCWPETINYSTIFGHDLPKACGWYMIAEKNGFVPASTYARVRHGHPGTTTVQS